MFWPIHIGTKSGMTLTINHIKMNNGRFVSVIISFIVIYCVAVSSLSMYLCWLLFSSSFFAVVRSLSSVFRPLRTHIRINRRAYLVCIIPFGCHPSLLCCFGHVLRMNAHMRCERENRTHAYVTGEDQSLLACKCVCVPTASACAPSYEFSIVYYSVFVVCLVRRHKRRYAVFLWIARKWFLR